MRALILSLFFCAFAVQAAPVDPQLVRVLDLAGVSLLCEQTAPLVKRGMSARQQAQLGKLFAAGPLCDDLARRLAGDLSKTQLESALASLDSPLARQFTDAEHAVGGDAGLESYRKQIGERAPREDRVALIRRLDKAARTTELATLLRYEVGKTQAVMALHGRGEKISEKTLSERTASQVAPIRQSSAIGVEGFMLYAYRRIPSDQLSEYAALYEQPAVRVVLEASLRHLPAVFAARRAQLQ